MRRITEQMIRERDKWLGIVSELTDIDQRQIMGKSRVDDVVMARHLLSWVLHSLRGYSYPMLGMMLGRSHASCVHSNNVIENEHHTDEMQRTINTLKAYNNEAKIY